MIFRRTYLKEQISTYRDDIARRERISAATTRLSETKGRKAEPNANDKKDGDLPAGYTQMKNHKTQRRNKSIKKNLPFTLEKNMDLIDLIGL